MLTFPPLHRDNVSAGTEVRAAILPSRRLLHGAMQVSRDPHEPMQAVLSAGAQKRSRSQRGSNMEWSGKVTRRRRLTKGDKYGSPDRCAVQTLRSRYADPHINFYHGPRRSDADISSRPHQSPVFQFIAGCSDDASEASGDSSQSNRVARYSCCFVCGRGCRFSMRRLLARVIEIQQDQCEEVDGDLRGDCESPIQLSTHQLAEVGRDAGSRKCA